MAAKSLSKELIKGKLLQGTFANSTPAVQLSDPIVDTPMVLTLEQLRPYDHNPRLNRNPRYDDLRASILSRGLEASPPVTRRPGEQHFIIRNGGNTRLAILNELWRETGEEKFFRIHCLFRPWPSRGEILALTGHLAESDLHGELTFIERALGVERAREFYQLEMGAALSQRDLAKLLRQDGYPISQPHISKMQDAVRYLLPAIPNTLYAGLGKPQIEKLAGLRRASEKVWLKHAGATIQEISHEHLFQEVLSAFDQGEFSYERFQDELLHKLGQLLGQDYNSLKLDVLDPDRSSPRCEPLRLLMRVSWFRLRWMTHQLLRKCRLQGRLLVSRFTNQICWCKLSNLGLVCQRPSTSSESLLIRSHRSQVLLPVHTRSSRSWLKPQVKRSQPSKSLAFGLFPFRLAVCIRSLTSGTSNGLLNHLRGCVRPSTS